MREVKVNLTIAQDMAPDQLEYKVACVLFDQGIPIDIFTQQCTHGNLQCAIDGPHRSYTWQGEDRRQ